MFGARLKDIRLSRKLKLKELAALTGIDVTLISRFERGDRMPTKNQLLLLSEQLGVSLAELKKEWLADKVVALLQYEPMAMEALQVAESRVEYLTSKKVHDAPQLSDELQAKLDRADDLRKRWRQAQPLGPSQLRRLHEFFDIEYTFESNRIEGNTLTLQETALVVNEGLTIGGKSMREHLEVINHSEAIGFVRDLVLGKEDLSRRVVMEIHRLILKEVDNENAGRHRKVPVRISGSDTELPQPYLLEKLMEDYFEYYELHSKRLHPIILSAEMHERLVSIHPFVDGNGRTSRLVMNLILMSRGYTRANIKGDTQSRLAYYRALQQVQKNANPDPFYHLVADEVIRSLEQHLELV
ncbi:Fic family protein [Marinoscillum furvescens]|uniref:Helix-turn-helix protein n=1 Tax=Marinoscillum furvescens DSM 4134 TaxID=1122208 RepID=A0A3D9L3M3_MARFU|nr:Fic family protein [Marinoscillum furvescens]RED99843.1 helix-turn-helix protein [Marinoscillum furvescens DSM 4134]